MLNTRLNLLLPDFKLTVSSFRTGGGYDNNRLGLYFVSTQKVIVIFVTTFTDIVNNCDERGECSFVVRNHLTLSEFDLLGGVVSRG